MAGAQEAPPLPQGRMALLIHPGRWGLPSACPECLQACAYMCLAAVRHESVPCPAQLTGACLPLIALCPSTALPLPVPLSCSASGQGVAVAICMTLERLRPIACSALLERWCPSQLAVGLYLWTSLFVRTSLERRLWQATSRS